MSKSTKITSKTNRLYIGKSTLFKLFLLVGVALISSIFVWYTLTVIERLKKDTRSQVEKYVKMWQLAANSPSSETDVQLQFIFDEIIVKATFPIIVLDKDRNPIHWRNIEGVTSQDTTPRTIDYLKKVAEEMIEAHGEFPLYFGEDGDGILFVNYFCYGDSEVVKKLMIMPFVEIGILVAFLIIAFVGYQNLRQSEERHIWVGMAKETAHQLGTPISSLMGWLEVIAADEESPENKTIKIDKEITSNIKVDVARLQKIANRFGLIGSIPELKETDLKEVIQDSIDYYSRRLPFEGEGVKLTLQSSNIPNIPLNSELFSWVLENLIKNALQAVDLKTGMVTVKTSTNNNLAIIEVVDNGEGISPVAARKIFKAGFTTKKRGWGLGLTLVKRIVEEYHNGKVFLKKSKPGETIFEIQLPISNRDKG
ncbi:MAG: HAMP domain-containing sensor histidine kinase [candidate division Zixibacteria bacterium]|nr:HAMP domain-containing sensor histidine kinase [candidate division Zixibacteria bacterium]